jgi:bacillithiol system protein YtxJ
VNPLPELLDLAGLDAALADPRGVLVLFKHSTRCPVSAAAKDEVEDFAASAPAGVRVLLLDLIAHRDVSHEIARRLQATHESPQALVLREGRLVRTLNHGAVTAAALRSAAR